MNIKYYINIVKKNLKLISFITILCVIVAFLLSYFVVKPQYKSNISVFINGTNANSTETFRNSDFLMYRELVETYGKLGVSRSVAKDIIKELDLDLSDSELLSMISYEAVGSTQFLKFTVTSYNIDDCSAIANQLASSLKKISKEIDKNKLDYVQLIDPATIPTAPFTPNIKLNTFIAFVLGVFISLGIVFLRDFMDNTVKSEDELSNLLNLSVIGIIPTTNN